MSTLVSALLSVGLIVIDRLAWSSEGSGGSGSAALPPARQKSDIEQMMFVNY